MFLKVNQGPESKQSDTLRVEALFSPSSQKDPNLQIHSRATLALDCPSSPGATPVSLTMCNAHFSNG